MNRIILAYAPENTALADSIDRSLSRIGIPFELANGAVASQITSAGEPVLLLVTDNLLKSRTCMEGLLPVLQGLAAENRLVAVMADGLNAEGQAVPTEIHRMANVVHYMKHWQDAWLELSDRHQQLVGEEKAALSAEMDTIHGIANQVGDFVSTLRDAGYLTLKEFEANDFEAFFQKFDLQDWHGQYKRLVASEAESQSMAEPPHLPEMPLSGGLLAPEPLLDENLETAKPQNVEPQNEKLNEGPPAITNQPPTISNQPPAITNQPSEEEQAARDAWLWIEKGRAEQGLELFRMALLQYPLSEWLRAESERAALLSSPQAVEQEAPSPGLKAAPDPSDEIKSYDIMGDKAVERGDYLFAKYCWDRVVEMDANFPNIYRKLGLMTAEHLHDDRETTANYLRKALETSPDDPEVRAALGQQASESGSRQVTVAVGSSSGIGRMQVAESGGSLQKDQDSDGSPSPNTQISKSPLILITGATSGIGRATAEIFARNGYRLILTGRRVERLVELKNRFEAEFGSEVLLLPFDVRDAGAVEAALANLPESYRDIDILVNNAGLAKGLASIHEGELEHWETMIDTNLKGLLYVTRLVSPGMVARRQGHIINVGSSAGKEAYPKGNVYCATKFAVDALTKAMRFDLHAHNIRVSQVSPGHVEETEFAITRFDGDAERAKIYNDFQPLKSSDIADAIYFMATRPAHVNIQDLQVFATQQASSMVIDRSGRG